MSKKYLFSLICLLLTSCNTNSNVIYKDNNLKIEYNPIKEFDFHSLIQQDYLNEFYTTYEDYANANEEISKPRDLEISFDISSNYTNLNYKFYLDNDLDFTTSKEYILESPSIKLNNLLLNETYYFKFEVYNDDKFICDYSSTFKTTTSKLRNLSIPNVKNARDIGGYTTFDNQVVKQGLFYRTGRLNKSDSDEYICEIENDAKEIFKDLNIKSEVDLRFDGYERGYQEKSPIDNALYYNYPMSYSGNILLMNKEVFPSIFSFLANEDNYPLIIHCNIGTDRTGLICFLVECLLGMKLEDIYRDYLFSNFSNIGSKRTEATIDSYLKIIGTYSNENLKEKTENYLISLGVKKEDIDSLRNILLIS